MGPPGERGQLTTIGPHLRQYHDDLSLELATLEKQPPK